MPDPDDPSTNLIITDWVGAVLVQYTTVMCQCTWVYCMLSKYEHMKVNTVLLRFH